MDSQQLNTWKATIMDDLNHSDKAWQRKTEAKAMARLDAIDAGINIDANFRMLGFEMADCLASGDNAPWDRKLLRQVQARLRMHGERLDLK
jgi:hypothetical protein